MKKIRKINQGGYGVVFEVELSDGSRVALKEFAPTGVNTASELTKLRKRFGREVKMQKILQKYGTLPILDEDLTSDPPWFTMPLATQTYIEQIQDDRRDGKITSEPLADILNCLEQIHQRGIVHRDLKPANILKLNDQWYLGDLGLVMSPDLTANTKLTTIGSAYGSIAYMAPEQLNDFSHVTFAADIYSFGCILHDLVDGGVRQPYGVASTNGKWDPVIRKCTAFDPLSRFASIKALRAVVLQTARKHSNITQSPDTIAWTTELENIKTWEPEKFAELAKHVEGESQGSESGVMAELTAEHLMIIKSHPESWFRIGHAYARWIAAGFTFAFCDVVADRALTFFDGVEDLELKSEIIVGLLQLATYNHRFYVMRECARRMGQELDTFAAERIQIEIQAGEHEDLLERCVSDLHNHSIEDYHPLLRELIAAA